MPLINFDMLTLVLSATVGFCFGAVWYSKPMFGKIFYNAVPSAVNTPFVAFFIEYLALLSITTVLALVMNFFSIRDFGVGWLIAATLIILALITHFTTDAVRRADDRDLWIVNLCYTIGVVLVIGSSLVILSSSMEKIFLVSLLSGSQPTAPSYYQYFSHLVASSSLAWLLVCLWYSPLFFGRLYADGIGNSVQHINSISVMFNQWVATLTLTYVADIALTMIDSPDFGLQWFYINTILVAFLLVPTMSNSLWRGDTNAVRIIDASSVVVRIFAITFSLTFLHYL